MDSAPEKRQNTGNREASPYTAEDIKIARMISAHTKVNKHVCEWKKKKIRKRKEVTKRSDEMKSTD